MDNWINQKWRLLSGRSTTSRGAYVARWPLIKKACCISLVHLYVSSRSVGCLTPHGAILPSRTRTNHSNYTLYLLQVLCPTVVFSVPLSSRRKTNSKFVSSVSYPLWTDARRVLVGFILTPTETNNLQHVTALTAKNDAHWKINVGMCTGVGVSGVSMSMQTLRTTVI